MTRPLQNFGMSVTLRLERNHVVSAAAATAYNSESFKSLSTLCPLHQKHYQTEQNKD